MKRYGAVIVFREDVPREVAQNILNNIAEFVEPEYSWRDQTGSKTTKLETFDDEMGGPVWYIP